MINREDLVVCLQFKSYCVVIPSQVLACKDSGYDWFEQLLQNVRFFFFTFMTFNGTSPHVCASVCLLCGTSLTSM